MALVTLFLVPITPYVMYSQLLAAYRTWRWIMWISLIGCALPTAGLVVSYWPQPIQGVEESRREILKKIDWGGGFLSIAGVVLL